MPVIKFIKCLSVITLKIFKMYDSIKLIRLELKAQHRETVLCVMVCGDEKAVA